MWKSYINTRRWIGTVAFSAVAGLLAASSLAVADETFSQIAAIPVTGGILSFDIGWVDPNVTVNGSPAYFLADRTNVSIDVVDTGANSLVNQIKPGFVGFTGHNETSGPNGVLTINNNGSTQIWAGDGKSRVWVLSYPSGTPVMGFTNPIPTGDTANRADELCYDSTDHLIVIANDADTPPFISFIPTQGPSAYTVVKKISFPQATNGIEQCQWNPRTGLIYLNIPEWKGNGNDSKPGRVEVIDPVTMDVVRSFTIPLPKCAGPQGMAIGPAPQILLGCNAAGTPENGRDPDTGAKFGTGPQNSVVIDENAGNVLAVLNGLGGADEVWFNPGDQHYSLALGSLLPNEEVAFVDSAADQVDQTIQTGNAGGTTRRAHSVAAEPVHNQVYVPIPKTGGGTPGFTSELCGALAGSGCIAVFKPSGLDADDAAVTASFVRRHGKEN
jgi:hypothetical protein